MSVDIYTCVVEQKKEETRFGGMGVSALFSGGFETNNATAVLRSKVYFPKKTQLFFR